MSHNNALADEIEALKSIYDKDLKYEGREVIITLFPLQEKEKKEIYAQLDLCVICSELYPEENPKLSIKNVKGLSISNVEILYSKLKDLAKSLKGQVMIYDLAYCVQEFLSEHNRPGKKSCYEEMQHRKELQKQEEYKSEVHEKTKLLKNIQEKQQEMLQLTDYDSSDFGEDEEEKLCLHSDLNIDKHKLSNVTVKEEMICEHKNCKYLQFNNKILRGCCVEHDTNSVIYCAIDSTTGDQLLVQEWILKAKNKTQESSAAIRQSLETIQNELGSLKKICHENLISYIDFKWSFEKGDWYVYILQEYVTGCNLNMFINQSTELNLNFIRYIISGILNALDFLHNNGIVHGSFNESSVYFTKSGVIKVGNYGIKKLMDELHESLKFELLPQIQKKMSQKSDIFSLGAFILKLMKLSVILHENIVVPDFQPPELKDLVEKCLIENEESRWTARELLNHKFVRGRERRPTILKKKSSGENNSGHKEEEIEKPYSSLLEEDYNRNSWLTKEFKILDHLGSGSFGRVLKVKNKLDGSIYAIKAIRLNTKNKQLGKKMIREVKLLSKLNHENVVRYYFSWIETESNSIYSSTANEDSDEVDSKIANTMSHKNIESDDENDDEEDDEEDEEDEEDEINGKNLRNLEKGQVQEEDQSSFIVFLNSETDGVKETGKGDERSRESEPKFIEPIRTMYIQMEFCEKSTLRIAINETNGMRLCEDEARLWRLFREIVEGLAYVHGQGMIHRDLKPENIFLDSSDHVKIGDFGLAISVVSKTFIAPFGSCFGAGDVDASSQNIYDNLLTGKVGTSLYVAPELDKTFEKSYYNEKVDIYSLGIIFFEMCHGPFTTNMERIETLLNLRKPEMNFPILWEENFFKQKNLVKMLLNHDPKTRPSCQEILEGDYLLPAEFEYEQFQDILRQTLSNSKSKAYKYLVSSCFDQEVRIEDEITYQWDNIRSEKQHFILDMVKERTEKILKKHGAVYLSVPLLLPQNKENRSVEARVQLMTHSGSIVNLPYDLRTSFARYLACRAFTRLRRYVVERVYKEKKVHGLHPKEQFECAFDLVTPSSGIENAKVEALMVIQEIINDFKSLKNRNCVIRLNHSLLLRALLIHFNSEKWYKDIFKILADAKGNKYFKSKIESGLQLLGNQIGNALINLLTKEDSLNNLKKELLSLINKRGKALDMLNLGFDQLNAVISKAEREGMEIPMKIALGVVCNSEQCSDIMFDVVFRMKQKRKKEETVTLMSGCRYDGLIACFRRLFELTGSNPGDFQPSAVGFSVYLDKIAAVLKEDNILSEYVVICSFGNNILIQAKQSMAKKLWESGIKGYVEETTETLEELTEYCRENKITHIVNLKDEESGFVYVMTWDNDKNHYLEKKVSRRDLIEHILKYNKTSEGHSSPLFCRYLSDPQGKTTSSDVPNGNQSINIHIISDDKLTAAQRRRWESQLRTRASNAVGVFSSRTRVEVVGVFLDERKVKELALNFRTTDSSDNILSESEISWKSMKQYILKICLKLRCLFSENSNAVIILYSLPTDKYAFILHS